MFPTLKKRCDEPLVAIASFNRACLQDAGQHNFTLVRAGGCSGWQREHDRTGPGMRSPARIRGHGDGRGGCVVVEGKKGDTLAHLRQKYVIPCCSFLERLVKFLQLLKSSSGISPIEMSGFYSTHFYSAHFIPGDDLPRIQSGS